MTRLNWLLIVCSLFWKNALCVPSFEFFWYFVYIFSEKIEWILYLCEGSENYVLHFRIEKKLFLFPISPSRKRPPRTASLLVDTSFRFYTFSIRIEPRPPRINKVMFCYDILMGESHEIFCFRFFSWIISPQAPANNVRVISSFFEN